VRRACAADAYVIAPELVENARHMWFDSRHRDHQLHGRTGILSGPRRPATAHRSPRFVRYSSEPLLRGRPSKPDPAVSVSARTSTCVMPILEVSPSRISFRADIRALIRRLGPSGRRSHPSGRRRPARSQCAGSGRRAAVIIDLAKSRGLGRAKSGFVGPL
jgi:hypothetical protein